MLSKQSQEMKITIVFLFLMFIQEVKGQDTLYFFDGTKMEVQVMEITRKKVKYKKGANINAPDRLIDRTKVDLVVFENGEQEIVNEIEIDSIALYFNRHSLSINLIQIVYPNLSISYEHILKSGFIGFRIPLLIGLDDVVIENSNFDPYNAIIGSGLDINFYPCGQGCMRYFIGPSFRITAFDYAYNRKIIDGQNEIIGVHPVQGVGLNKRFSVNNGFLFQPNKYFNISGIAGLGLQQGQTKYKSSNNVSLTTELNFSYRF